MNNEPDPLIRRSDIQLILKHIALAVVAVLVSVISHSMFDKPLTHTIPPPLIVLIAIYVIWHKMRHSSTQSIEPFLFDPVGASNANRLIARHDERRLLSKLLKSGSRVVLVTGESGVGKSSLLGASFVRQTARNQGVWWAYVDGGYESDKRLITQLKRIQLLLKPNKELAKAIQSGKEEEIERSLTAELKKSPTENLDQALSACGHVPICIVLDQFEQFFSSDRDLADRTRSIDMLLGFLEGDTNGRRHLVLTFRKEWLLDVLSLSDTFKLRDNLVILQGIPESAAESLIPSEYGFTRRLKDTLVDAVKKDGRVVPVQLAVLCETMKAGKQSAALSQISVDRILDQFLDLITRGYPQKRRLLTVIAALTMDRQRRRAVSPEEVCLLVGDRGEWVLDALGYLSSIRVVRHLHDPETFELMHDYLAQVLGDRVQQQLPTETMATMRFVHEAMSLVASAPVRMNLIRLFGNRWEEAKGDGFIFLTLVLGTILLLTRFFAGGVLAPLYNHLAHAIGVTSEFDLSYIPSFVAMCVSQLFVYRYLSDFFRYVPDFESPDNRLVNRAIAVLCLAMLVVVVAYKELWPILAGIGALAISVRCLLFRHQCRDNVQIYRRFTQYSRVTSLNAVIFIVVGSGLPIFAHNRSVIPNGSTYVMAVDWAYALIAVVGILYQMSIHFSSDPMENPFGYRLRGEVVRCERNPNLLEKHEVVATALCNVTSTNRARKVRPTRIPARGRQRP